MQARKGGQAVQSLDLRNCVALTDSDVACICQWFPHLQYALLALHPNVHQALFEL